MKRRITPLLLLGLFLSTTIHAQIVYLQNDSVFVENESAESIKDLNISAFDLKKLPANISDFSNLKKLNVSYNQLEDLTGISTLIHLEELILDGNKQLLSSSLQVELNQLKSLKKFSMTDAELLFIPSSIYQLPSLVELNLRNNEIDKISSEIKELKLLQYLDVAYNKIEYIDNGIIATEKLKSLDISNNQIQNGELVLIQICNMNQLEMLSMDYLGVNVSEFPIANKSIEKLTIHVSSSATEGNMLQLFTSLEELQLEGKFDAAFSQMVFESLEEVKLKKLTIFNRKLKEIPQSISKLVYLKEIELNCNELQTISPSINRLKSLQKITFQSSQLEMTSTINRLIPLVGLNQLTMKGMKKVELPSSIGSLKGLKKMNLMADEISILPKGMKRLESLKKLSIQMENESISNLEYLKEEMKGCTFVINSLYASRYNNPLSPPLEETDIEFEQYVVNSTIPKDIITGYGSQILVPADAFLDADGKVVNGNVEIEYREFNDPIDMAMAGVPMTEKSNGETYVYSSAGMMEFRAFQDGRELFPNPENPITINYNSAFQGDDYDLYYFDPTAKEWDNIGKDSIAGTTADVIGDVSSPVQKVLQAPVRPEAPVFPYKKDIIQLCFNYDKRLKMTHLYVHPNDKRRWGRRDTNNKVFSELKLFNREKWKVDYTENSKVERDELERFNQELVWYNRRSRIMENRLASRNRWGEINMIDDAWIEPNIEGDNFHFVISKSGQLIRIPIIPARIPSRAETAQRKIKSINQKYQRSLQKRKSDWEKVDRKYVAEVQQYNKELESYEKELKAYRKELREYNDLELRELNAYASNQENIVRSFQLADFGIYNCDIRNRMQQPAPLLASLVNENGLPLKVNQLFVLDYKINGLLQYYKGQEAYFDYNHSNGLIAILPKDKIAILKEENFNPAQMRSRNGKAVMKVFDTNETTIADLRKNGEFF